jgi:hypothetical protein
MFSLAKALVQHKKNVRKLRSRIGLVYLSKGLDVPSFSNFYVSSLLFPGISVNITSTPVIPEVTNRESQCRYRIEASVQKIYFIPP